MIPPPLTSTLFPYTTLFRSGRLRRRLRAAVPGALRGGVGSGTGRDRKSTRLNSSHGSISYAVFCLKKKRIGYSEIDWPYSIRSSIAASRGHNALDNVRASVG